MDSEYKIYILCAYFLLFSKISFRNMASVIYFSAGGLLVAHLVCALTLAGSFLCCANSMDILFAYTCLSSSSMSCTSILSWEVNCKSLAELTLHTGTWAVCVPGTRTKSWTRAPLLRSSMDVGAITFHFTGCWYLASPTKHFYCKLAFRKPEIDVKFKWATAIQTLDHTYVGPNFTQRPQNQS